MNIKWINFCSNYLIWKSCKSYQCIYNTCSVIHWALSLWKRIMLAYFTISAIACFTKMNVKHLWFYLSSIVHQNVVGTFSHYWGKTFGTHKLPYSWKIWRKFNLTKMSPNCIFKNLMWRIDRMCAYMACDNRSFKVYLL